MSNLETRVAQLEQDIRNLQAKYSSLTDRWITPAAVAAATNNKWGKYEVAQYVADAISDPDRSPLQSGIHYKEGAGARPKINLPRWLEVDWDKYLTERAARRNSSQEKLA